MTTFFGILLQTLGLFGLGLSSAQAQTDLRTIPEVTECEASKTPLFGSDSLIKIEILSDMERYLDKGDQAHIKMKAPGVVTFEDENFALNFSPIRFETRGNSRFLSCEYKPIRLSFLDAAIEKNIETEIGPYVRDKPAYLQSYMTELKTLYANDLIPESQPEGLFSRIGDDVKLVTHCGKSKWPVVGGDTPEIYNDRLFGELLTYQIVGALNTVTLRTRLAEITYLNADGSVIDTFWGFFRENPSSLAERCGLLKEAGDKPVDRSLGSISSEVTSFYAEFINELISNKDYRVPSHNIKTLYRDSGDTVQPVYLAYDFDLNGILVPHYFKNQGVALDKMAANFATFVRSFAADSEDKKSAALKMVQRSLDAEAQIRALIEASQLSPKMKQRFQDWQGAYFAELRNLTPHL